MGNYTLIDDQRIENCINEIKGSKGKYVQITDAKRTFPQNSYYWSIVDLIANESGSTKEDIHMELCARTIGFKHVIVLGKEICVPKSSRQLSKEDFGKLIDAATMCAGILNIRIPAPSHFGQEY